MRAGSISMADYTDTIDLATRIHAGCGDKAGKPYIEHLSRVAKAVLAAGGSEAQVVAAYLHDAIEDTLETAQSLRANGVSDEAITLIDVLTRREGEDHATYIARVVLTPDAIPIKVADTRDNLLEERLALLDPETRARLVTKYQPVLEQLGVRPGDA